MTTAKVEIRGLRELGAAFRQVDGNIPKELRTRFLRVSEKVASSAAGKVPRQSGRAAGSIKARATAKGASIAFGGSAAPYYPWLDFGGAVGRNDSVIRPYEREGRYIYPTIKDSRDDIEREAGEAVEQAAQSAGFETHGG